MAARLDLNVVAAPLVVAAWLGKAARLDVAARLDEASRIVLAARPGRGLTDCPGPRGHDTGPGRAATMPRGSSWLRGWPWPCGSSYVSFYGVVFSLRMHLSSYPN